MRKKEVDGSEENKEWWIRSIVHKPEHVGKGGNNDWVRQGKGWGREERLPKRKRNKKGEGKEENTFSFHPVHVDNSTIVAMSFSSKYNK